MSLNSVTLMGRITKDPELKQTASGISVVSFSLAVDRSYAKEGEKKTDFINCTAWRSTAEFISKYVAKGQLIAVDGRLQTNNYEDAEGNKHYQTEVVIDEVYFCGRSGERNE